jgi:spore coat protein U-like protein
VKKELLAALMLVASVALTEVSYAETLGIRMDVSATVEANCQLNVPPLSFGVYDPLALHAVQPADANTVLTVNCTRNTTASVSFDFGGNAFGQSQRRLRGGSAETLQYEIYRDSSRSQVWAVGADSIRIVSRGIRFPEQLTVFGRIPPSQEVEPGMYTDVLTATVDF